MTGSGGRAARPVGEERELMRTPSTGDPLTLTPSIVPNAGLTRYRRVSYDASRTWFYFAIPGRQRKRANTLIAGIFTLAIALLGKSAVAEGPPPTAGRVTGLTADGALTLTDGSEIMSAAVTLPRRAIYTGDRAEPLADAAARRLIALTKDQQLSLAAVGARPDRLGRWAMRITLTDGRDLQRVLLVDGLARVERFDGPRDWLTSLLAAEKSARDARQGIWATPAFAVRPAEPPDGLARDLGKYVLVSGVVVASAARATTVYLNFGTDWRRDFTAKLTTKIARVVDAPSLVGRTVLIRGYLSSNNGPMIEVADPLQIATLP